MYVRLPCGQSGLFACDSKLACVPKYDSDANPYNEFFLVHLPSLLTSKGGTRNARPPVMQRSVYAAEYFKTNGKSRGTDHGFVAMIGLAR